MRRMAFGLVFLGLAFAAGAAWALSDADTGGEWVQAPSPQKIQVANILTRELGGDPWKMVQCLDQLFAGGANGTVKIRDAAQRCVQK